MIDIQFKKCCHACSNIDVSYDQTRGFGEVVTVIGCNHACVCGDFNAEELKEEWPTDITVKGFHDADG